MTIKIKTWLRNLVAAVVTGGATSGLSALGISVADAAGAQIGPLNFKQVGVLFLSGALVGLLAYLRQSPIPPAEDDEPSPKLGLWLAGGLLALSLAACASINTATVTLTSVVDRGMKDWAKASVAGKTTPALDAKVIAAHDKYREACGTALVAYEAAQAAGDKPSAATILGTLRSSIDPLMDLILPVVSPTESASLTTQLRKVNAP